ncbi:hypothetical protein ACFV9C_41610 [Kribbella sp. NPDC059898]|uniref:hypothetical protein n=1 Tax=Kribbella sp. NPDC059898 TaxID=3346995 RepID=UPI003669D9B1
MVRSSQAWSLEHPDAHGNVQRPATDLVLEPEVTQAVEAFRARYSARIDDPLFVRERCAEISGEFAEVCMTRHLPARTIAGARFGEDPRFPGVRLMLAGHFAAVVPLLWDEHREEWAGEAIVDWTVHQFTDINFGHLPVPWVTTVRQWRTHWQPISSTVVGER